MDIRELFAANLRRLRNLRGYSQEELAHRADIDRTYVSMLERCIYSASLDVIGRIAGALDVDPAELLARPPRSTPRKARGTGASRPP